MIVNLKQNSNSGSSDARKVQSLLEQSGIQSQHQPEYRRLVVGCSKQSKQASELKLSEHPAVEHVTRVDVPYKLASRELTPQDTVVQIGKASIGGGSFCVMAGPCAVESTQSFDQTIAAVLAAGAHVARGGAFKPRTSPYSFQGLGLEGLQIMKSASERLGIPTVTEIVDSSHVEAIYNHVDAFQVGARNMQNFELLKVLGQAGKPVLLKRGMSASLKELLMAAEYILAAGNSNVVLCERGIRTFETATRNTLDLSAVPYLKEKTHLPVIVDPSHGTGVRTLVAPMARAALACGADGVIVEVHHDPDQAESDGAQSLHPWQFEKLMSDLRKMGPVMGKVLAA